MGQVMQSEPCKEPDKPIFRRNRNAPWRMGHSHFKEKRYELFIVEFDDQGRSFGDRSQIEPLAKRFTEATNNKEDLIVLAFAHGWRHNASDEDTNFCNFKRVLEETAEVEAQSRKPRPVVGVYVAWRGLSWESRCDLIEWVTFWGRQTAGRRVGAGSSREVFGRLRHYRHDRVKGGGAPVLVIVGHSFGGLVVYTAMAQSLIEAASTDPDKEAYSNYADLVLLVNPAFEGARYLPIQDLVTHRQHAPDKLEAHAQPPLFISVTSKTDDATKKAFPLGNLPSLLWERWRDRRERQAILNTMGHIEWMRTHDLDLGPDGNWEIKPPTAPQPFWVVAADDKIIHGHSEIFTVPFLKFLKDQIFRQVTFTRKMPAPDISGRATPRTRKTTSPRRR